MGQVSAATEPKRLGAYRIEAVLGQGGMGEVFLAWDERLNRHVAVKRIRLDKSAEESNRIRFRREARAVARVSHPAIVQIFDVLETDEGDWIVMEHVNGKPLTDLVARRALDLELTLRLANEIADALAEAHAKILDFGLARALWPTGRSEDDEEKLSETGALVGTVHAMSPEQAAGGPVDHRSDLFALGSLLYEMLAGRAPFRGDALLDSLRRVFTAEPPPLCEARPDLPPEVDDLVRRLLAKDPAKRPQNARLVADELEKLRAQAALREPSEDLENQPTLAMHKAPVPSADEEPADDSVVIRVLVMSDMVDSTRWIEDLGDQRASELFRRHDRMARDLLKRFDGVEIDKSDGFLLLFERPAEAVAYALGYHDALAELSDAESVELTARVGVHLGEVHLRRNPSEDVTRGAKPLEVEGLAKSTAARVASLAGARQTLLTRAVFDLARRAAVGAEPVDDRLRWLAHGAYLFQGVEEPMEVFEVGREGFAPLVEPEDRAKARRVVAFHEEPVLGWRPAAGQGVPRRPSWVLEERMGEGGVGEVWLARHKSGEQRVFKFCFEADRLRSLKREVTLFRLLKEALGHRHDIARILDWNFDLAPFYLEAEYTRGGNLAEWTKVQGGIENVPMETRLALVADVAEALAAAHSVGILHKDVKPANVLVTEDHEGRPRAQLTDFGIGLLTDRRRLEVPGITAMGFTATLSPTGSSGGGTLAYLAPELIEGKAATVQADIYSLGVMLYQLLAGDFGRTLASGWRRDVEDHLLAEDLASFVDGIPEHRPASALEVAERLRGLEARRAALEAERRDREEAAEGRRVLEQQRRRRRNYWIAWTVAAFLLLVASFTLVLFNLLQEARAQRDLAEKERDRAERLSDFFSGLFYTADPNRAAGREFTVRQLIDPGRRFLMAQLLKDEPEARVTALKALGHLYIRLGYFAEARELLAEEVRILKEIDDQSPELASELNDLAVAYARTGDPELAESMYRDAIDMRRRLGDEEHNLTTPLSNLAKILMDRGEAEEAEKIYRQTLEIRRKDGEPLTVARSLRSLAVVLLYEDKLDEAEPLLLEALEIRRNLQDDRHPDVALVLSSLGRLRQLQGRLEEAQATFEETLSIRIERLGEDHDYVALSRKDLASVLLDRGAVGDAVALLNVALPVLRQKHGQDDWTVAEAESLLGACYLAQGRPEDAAPLIERGYRIISEARPHSIYERKARHRLDELHSVVPQ